MAILVINCISCWKFTDRENNNKLSSFIMNDTTEEQAHQVTAVDSAVVQLVQITDCHIFATAEKCLRDWNTRQSFAAVSNAAIEHSGKLDLLLATGDLSQDGTTASYDYLAQSFDDMGVPTFWLPGNHDDSDAIREHFKGKWIHASKHVLIGGWQIVLLNSTIEGEVYGRVPVTQLEFLQRALKAYPDRHALVCLHHQALDCGSEWLDLIGLQDSAQLRAQLALHDNVKAVLWGHVHQESDQVIDDIRWMSTPSSCVQFKPGSKDFALGSEAPGYRHLSLYADGKIETAVQRVAHRESADD
jgi:Icc protein